MGGTIMFELALTFYFVAAIVGLIDIVKGSAITTRLTRAAAFAGFFFHSASIIYRYVAQGHLPIASPHEAASFFAWAIVLVYFVMDYRYKPGLLGAFIMPVPFALMLAASMLSREMAPLAPSLESYWLGIHTLLAFVGNACFTLSAVIGVMYLVQEHYLKSKHLGALFERLPSIITRDYFIYRLITFGFPLLTLAMITGALWANNAWGSYWNWDAREVWSLVTWLIYATILHARLMSGWRGRKAALLSILGFITILIAFFGIKLLQKGMHVF